MDIGQHFRIIWRRRVPILLLSLAIAGLVFLWSSRQPKVYQASSQVSVDAVTSGVNVQAETQLATRSYAQLATSTPVLQSVIESEDLHYNVNQLKAHLSVSSASDVPLITIVSRGPSTTRAITVNKAVGDALVAKVESDQATKQRDDLAKLQSEIDRQTDVVKNT